MLVFVRAWEGMYQGLHGIEDFTILNVSNCKNKAENEIEDWAEEAIEELIESYGLEEEYQDDSNSDIELDYHETVFYEDSGWAAYKIKEDINLSQEELEHLCVTLGADLFIEDYCEDELFI